MTPLPRVRCPVCNRSVPVRTTGELREHKPDPTKATPVQSMTGPKVDRFGNCEGSGRRP